MNNQKMLETVRKIIEEERSGEEDRSWHSHLLTKQFEFEHILPNMSGDKILELGSAGHLLTTRIFSAMGMKVHLADLTDRSGNIPDNVTFFHSDWFDFIPPAGAEYTDIFFVHGLEHVSEGASLLKKIKGWMSSETVFHLIVPNALSFHRMLGAKMGMLETPYSLNENDIVNGHVKMYDMDMLKDAVTEAGYKILSIEGIQFKPLTDSKLYEMGDDYIRALEELSDKFIGYCSEIYICAGV